MFSKHNLKIRFKNQFEYAKPTSNDPISNRSQISKTLDSSKRSPIPTSGWKRIQPVEKSELANIEQSQRHPRLGSCALQNAKPIFDAVNGPDTSNVPITTGTNFSVSFDSPLEVFPSGTRLSPVGSSCWSSEQHISPDLTSFISDSTNSVSADISFSSGRHGLIKSVLHRQPSGGTGCLGGTYSTETGPLQSGSHSVRSAPLCLSNVNKSSLVKHSTFDRTFVNQSELMPISTNLVSTPSLIVSVPEEEMYKKRMQL